MATPTSSIVQPAATTPPEESTAVQKYETAAARGLVVKSLSDYVTLGELLVKSGCFADMRQAAQAVVKVLAGAELGFGPIASMNGIHMVAGKPTLSANLIAAAIKRTGKYNYRVRDHSEETCAIEFFEGKESIGLSTFTLENAIQANLINGKNAHSWKQYRRNMLFARALSNGARWYCPDVFGGPVYTPEELDVKVAGEEGTVIEVEANLVPPPPAVPPEDLFVSVKDELPNLPDPPKPKHVQATEDQMATLKRHVNDLRLFGIKDADIKTFLMDVSGTKSQRSMTASTELTAKAIDACEVWLADLEREKKSENPFDDSEDE